MTAGEQKIYINGPNGGNWKPLTAFGGDQNVVIRLSQMPKETRFREAKSSVAPASVVAKIAPKIQATQWSNGRELSLSQLRGKPVLLVFDVFIVDNQSELRDFARAFASVQVLGVQLKIEGMNNPRFNVSADGIAQKMGFPIAVDAALPRKAAIGWQTYQS